ncbi:MAG TPA: VWA domain-containing protein [Caldilineae bacterium]|nr:VWA domain-containing protein [Caldilineae bacterium]
MGIEERLIEFIAGLRAEGVRISVAESADSFKAVEEIGVVDRDAFRAALRTTLIKEPADIPVFERLFPLYFGLDTPPMLPAMEGMSPNQQQELMRALRSLSRRLAELLQQLLSGQRLNAQEMAELRSLLQMLPDHGEMELSGQELRELQDLPDQMARELMDRLAQLLSWLLSGQGPTREALEQLGREAGLSQATHLYQQPWLTRRMLQAMGISQAIELLEQILQRLAEAGAGQEALQRLAEAIQANVEALSEQVGQFVGASIARQAAERWPRPTRIDELMHRPFHSLSPREAEELRDQVRKLAARLRSRAALRHRKGKNGILDPKATIRANLRYGGVPMEIRHKRRHLKPKLVLICDVSTSMRPVVEFLLRLIYELQDQVAHARSFAFIDDIQEITQDFAEFRPEVAIRRVLERMPPGHYNTDLGFSLAHFCREFLDAVDHRTTVIVVGDARNNFNSPRLDAFETIRRRARRVLWFNPEPPTLWGTGDSDMYEYLPFCDAVHEVGNLAQLAEAVDRLFVG